MQNYDKEISHYKSRKSYMIKGTARHIVTTEAAWTTLGETASRETIINAPQQ